jgi:hypothetical protein
MVMNGYEIFKAVRAEDQQAAASPSGSIGGLHSPRAASGARTPKDKEHGRAQPEMPEHTHATAPLARARQWQREGQRGPGRAVAIGVLAKPTA